ncbi:uncharacterized protein J7T54_000091 [Emericellopsis cladophorae]|uniref:Uncharacterized protein n=1 Tax=Emericellopsis cladophorae TaxID=2686198 RepID=A0A9Q0BD53_9HYPO|nr:uncharacterized protein J7T54_000091 [Emericellopsis cladophorae]KAI6780185.1 hypothetical protein J7T54_000091 [Emericellopsis cladophorae]
MPHTVEVDAATMNIKDAWAVKEACEAADGYTVASMGMEEWKMTVDYEHGIDNATYEFGWLVIAIQNAGFTVTHGHNMHTAIADYQTIDLLVTK